jgi:sarcosine oxidase subunit gamma
MITAASPGRFRIAEPVATRRRGIKGADAAALLTSLGIAVPTLPNRHVALAPPARGRCLRLGSTEFLLEQDDGDALLLRVDAALAQASARTLAALRCDRSFLLDGAGLFPALREIAAFDFESLPAQPDVAIMTLLAGISVTLVPECATGATGLRLWCDPSFGDYLLECFIALGGEHISPDELLPSTPAAQGNPA